MFIGKQEYLNDSLQVAEIYKQTAKSDEISADLLYKNKLFNQSAYFYVQSMEKYIKYYIASTIDITKKYFADEIRKTMGHSLEMSINFFINIYASNNETQKLQMQYQINKNILEDINFKGLHNNVRYPLYKENYSNYSMLKIEQKDCQKLKNILNNLKNYLSETKAR